MGGTLRRETAQRGYLWLDSRLLWFVSPQVADYRRQLGVRVSGFDAPRPVRSFAQCGFDAPLAAAITRAGFKQPTAIQAQALPAALSGRDVLVRSGWAWCVCVVGGEMTGRLWAAAAVMQSPVWAPPDIPACFFRLRFPVRWQGTQRTIATARPALQGIAKTGSGKTAAFVLPMIVHIMDQPELAVSEAWVGGAEVVHQRGGRSKSRSSMRMHLLRHNVCGRSRVSP